MPVYQLGALNTAALLAPDVYVNKIPPKVLYVNGVPTDLLGIVGIGSWGAVNSPVLAAPDAFGNPAVRKYDLATALAVASQNGANNIRAVRVTDGTDVAATTNLMDVAGTPAIGVTLTAYYTGTVGNTLTANVTAGTKASTYKIKISRPSYVDEVFDNIAGSGATFWANLVSAINNGQSGLRAPSQLVVASIGVGTAAPNVASTFSFASGTDGATTLTDALMVGTDSTNAASRKGMYALRGTGVQELYLCDVVDSTQWANIAAFCDNEGVGTPLQGTSGALYSTTAAAAVTAGVDTSSVEIVCGDFFYWQDNFNGVVRLLPPALLHAAKTAALAPHLSILNKPLAGVIGTARNSQNQAYSLAEIGAIAQARMDVLTNPCPGGSYYGFRTGRNSSSDPSRNGVNYRRMMNFLALTLAASYGWVIGEPQTTDLRLKAKSSMDAFLWNLQDLGMIGDVNGGVGYSVTLDASNNPDNRVAQGYMTADVQVKFLGIVWFFLVNLEGGQTVNVRLIGTRAA